MNTATLDTDYGVFSDTDSVRLQRVLPGPIERVWNYLTDSDLRRQWLAAGDMTPRVDSEFELVWRNDELTDPPGNKPDGFGDEHRMQGRITEYDPPRGDDVQLTLVHRHLGNRNRVLMHSAGWHAHLDLLADRVSGRKSEPFGDGWLRLKADYDARLPACLSARRWMRGVVRHHAS